MRRFKEPGLLVKEGFDKESLARRSICWDARAISATQKILSTISKLSLKFRLTPQKFQGILAASLIPTQPALRIPTAPAA